ncbi:MAG: GDSL-type esterase/lipase family protein, partial [Eubacteriales bacterium]|nr:GDSL-type esterase/lipase family protein [Eubacteriales bacterium]
SWGVENAQTLVAQKNPDLVIISFGMNDGAKAVAPQTYIDNLQSIMDTVRSSNPDVEFILVSSSLPNPESASVNAGSQELYLPYLQQLCNDAQGVALADITTPNQKLLEKKRFVDMTGNNINHPNDFMIRWYAQIISAIFLQ